MGLTQRPRWLVRELERCRRKAVGVVSRCVVYLTSDGSKGQEVQASPLGGETHDDVEHFQPFGFTSRLLGVGEAVFLAIGGDRAHGVVLAVQDRARRFRGQNGTGLAAGESAIYGADQQRVHCKAGGGVSIVPTESGFVHAGADLAEAFAARADYVDARLADLASRIDSHTHPAGALLDGGGVACSGVTGAANGSTGPFDSVAAKKVKVT